MSEPIRWVRAAARADLLAGDVVGVVVESLPVALVCAEDGSVHALADRCSHGEARLSDGFVLGDCIECPLHQGQFDIRTGAPLCEPVTEAVASWPVRVEDDAVWVGLPG